MPSISAPASHNARGQQSMQTGEYPAAAEYFIKAIEQDPKNEYLYNHLGQAMHKLRHFDAAIECFDTAIKINAAFADAYLNKGNALKSKHCHAAAIEQFNLTLKLRPASHEAYSNRGNALLALHQTDAAIASFEAALKIQPSNPQLLNHQGTAYKQRADIKNALIYYHRALKADPKFVDARINLANALLDFDQKPLALENYDRALALSPAHPEANFNRGLCLLQMGDFANGWQGYGWRWKRENLRSPYLATSKPLLATTRKTKKLLLWSEQGVGDEIMFAALLTQARTLADEILVQTDLRLIPLLTRSFPDLRFYSRAEPLPEFLFDHHLPLGSLCGLFLNSIEDFQKINTRYLVASDQYDIKASGFIHPKKINCGISWKSFNPAAEVGKSISLATLLAKLPLEKLNLVNLQYGDVTTELAEVSSSMGIEIQQHPSIDNMQDLDGLAALINACDMVVSIDNTTVHLAGALGKPVQVLLGPAPDWRWGFAPTRALWYEQTTLIKTPSDMALLLLI